MSETNRFSVNTIFLDDERVIARDYELVVDEEHIRTVYGELAPGLFVVVDDLRSQSLDAWREQLRLIANASFKADPELAPDSYNRETSHAAIVEVFAGVSEQGLGFPLIKLLSEDVGSLEEGGVLVAVALSKASTIVLNESNWLWVSPNREVEDGDFHLVAITDITHPLIIKSQGSYIIATSRVDLPFDDEIEEYLQMYPDLQQYSNYLTGKQ
jgi:hypothetical protein